MLDPNKEAVRSRFFCALKQPTIFHLVRHGQTEMNAKGLLTGSMDVGLTEQGVQQAKDLREHLFTPDDYDVVFTSALKRAIDTATIAGYHHKVVSPLLNERSLGILEGTLRSPGKVGLYDRPDGGESNADLVWRCLEFLSVYAFSGAQRILIFSHAGTIRALRAILLDFPEYEQMFADRIENVSVVRVKVQQIRFPLFLSANGG